MLNNTISSILGILVFPLVASGCTPDIPPPFSPMPQEEADRLVHSSYGQNQTIAWKCVEDASTSKSIWVDCEFFNGSKAAERGVCLSVYYKGENSVKVVSGKACSGNLNPKQSSIVPVRITGEKRMLIAGLCSGEITPCTLNTIEFVPVNEAEAAREAKAIRMSR
jgi:hypothetical protein